MAIRDYFLGSITCLTLIATPAIAQTITLPAVADNTLYEDLSGSLSNGAGDHFFAGTTGTGQIRRGLLKFNIAGSIPAGSIIQSVELKLWMSRTISTGVDVNLHRVLGNWGEAGSNAPGEEGGGTAAQPGDATWIHSSTPGSLWNTPGGDYSSISSATRLVVGVGSYAWNTSSMTTDVQSWLDDPSANGGWALLADETQNGTAKRFDSRESPDPLRRPSLIVTYVIPSPGVFTILLPSLVLSSRRRRR